MTDTGKHWHKLSLEVCDCGVREFKGSGESECQDELGKSIVWDFGRALAILNNPPQPHEAIQALSSIFSDRIWEFLAFAHEKWTAERSFDSCVSLVVDLDRLLKNGDDEDAAFLEFWAKQFGCNVTFVRSGGNPNN